MPSKAPDQPVTGADGNSLQVPQAVIAQAEAAASNTTTADPQAVRESARRQTVTAAGPSDPGFVTQSELSGLKKTYSKAFDQPVEHQPPPVFSDAYGRFDFNQDGFDTKAKVADDGRVNIKINQKSRRLSELLVPALRSQLNAQQVDETEPSKTAYIPPSLGGKPGQQPPPPMNVVIHIVGSRGDVQPFVALGKVLKEEYMHRVRIATHPTFKKFVEENGLEFFSIGGDPAELMAFMVKNPGLMPGMESLRSGDVGKRRKGIYEIIQGCWRSCIEVGDGSGPAFTDDNFDSRASLDSGIGMELDPSAKPFVADAIIANPPSFAAIHCAEKLGIPLHLMFTMPWSPTQAFPHPLANVQASNADTSITNFVSYALVEMMTWQGLGDLINRFREKTLGLEEVSLMWAPGMASRLRIPYTYCWSPALIPKPKDWGSHISISGFYFLSLASNFTPEPDLAAFLDAGPPPVYIGFGSIVVDDPNAMTKLIFDAVKKTGQRALVSKGWGGFGANELGIPEGVFMLGNVPHDWLFKRVSCVVHHGGAGTTAAGIALGKPTVIVPFFGDQPFWGAMVAKAGAGPTPIPSKQLTAENLAGAILEALKPATLERAKELGAKIASEKGNQMGAKSFHDQMDVESLRCSVAPSRAAVWRVKRTMIRLSAFAATSLANEGLLDFKDLKLYRPKEYDSEDGPWDPLTGGASSLIGTISSLAMGFADFPVEILKAFKGKTSEEQASTDEASVKEKDKSMNSSKTSLESSRSGDKDVERVESTSPTEEIQPVVSGHASPSGEHALSPQTSRLKAGPGSLAKALTGSLNRSSSRSSSPNRLQGQKTNSSIESGQISVDAAVGATRSVGRIVGVGLKSPMDFTLSIARGFHNAPKLYGDESVRQNDKITNFQSGLKVAGKEFGYGMYDGISGLLTQPIDGAKKEGVAGLVKGVGKGLGGFLLKPSAAIWGVPGYTFKGIYKEIQSHLGSSTQNYIVAARTAQGYDDWHNSTREERLDVVSKWQAIQLDLGKEREHVRHGSIHGPQGFLKTRHLSFDERKRLAEEKRKSKKTKDEPKSPHRSSSLFQKSKHHRASSTDQSADFEQAIQASVAATSKGNPEEDRMIENAIRASVAELQAAEKEGDDKDAIQRAIRASVNEATRARQQRSKDAKQTDGTADRDSERDHKAHDEELESALHRSVTNEERHPLSGVDFDDSGIDTDNDEDVRTAIALSKESSARTVPVEAGAGAGADAGAGTETSSGAGEGEGDKDLDEAIRLSEQSYAKDQEQLNRSRTEEEIVLEYIKKQSLEEAKFGKKGPGEGEAVRGAVGKEDVKEKEKEKEVEGSAPVDT